MITWAFLFVEKGCSPQRNKVEMEHNGNRLLVCGVDNVEQGAIEAKRMVEEENCTLIELCGGFHEAGAKAVKAAAGPACQVGYVVALPGPAE